MAELYQDSAFMLAALGIFFTCCGVFLKFILKSRCTTIRCCGCFIERDVIPAARAELQLPNQTSNQV